MASSCSYSNRVEHIIIVARPTYSANIQFLHQLSWQPGHNIRPHAHLPRTIWERIASQLNVALIRKLRGSLLFLAYFFKCHPRVYVQHKALADVRSTGAGIKSLYCIYKYVNRTKSPANLIIFIHIS